jgi:hypothetical protein
MALADILKAANLSEEQIKAIETEATGEATRLKAEAAADLVAAQKERTDIKQWWEKDATKQLNETFSERDNAKAMAEYYRAQAESAKASGFIPKDAPGYTPPTDPANPNRDPKGQFVANANPVPGSPQYMTLETGLDALSTTAELLAEHQHLFNQPLRNFRELIQEATNRSGMGRKVSARQVWEEKYKVGERIAAIEAEAKTKERESIAKEEREKIEREIAEKGGSNPFSRSAEGSSNFSRIARAEAASKDQHPVWQRGPRERRQADREFAHKAVSEKVQ